MKVMVKIGQQIKKHREAQGMSMKDLGDKLGVSKQYIYALESGRKACSLEKLSEIAQALDVDLSITLD